MNTMIVMMTLRADGKFIEAISPIFPFGKSSAAFPAAGERSACLPEIFD
jgi:hypothetical protein